jgi:tetratricopeptide (TPR) repeat protein
VWLHSALLLECCERIERALNAVAADTVLDKGVRMRLYLALGYAMVFTMGNVERTRGILTAALALADELSEQEAQLSILGGLAALQFMDGESQGAQETAERVLVLARQTNDPVAARLGERLSGNALQFWGRQVEAQLRLENVLNLPPLLQDNRRGTRLFRYDQHALARAMLARVLWLRGAASQAVKHAKASLKEIQASNDQLSLCWVLYYGMIPVSFMTADLDAAEQSVAMLVDPAVGLSSGIWRVIGSLLKGKLMVARGDGEEGIAMLRSGIEMSDRQGWTLSYPEFLCSLAQGLAAVGRHDEAITRIDQGLSLASSDREQWYQPELIRTKGELLLERSGSQAASAAAECFGAAISLAQAQGALSWQLRAAHSLARLRRSLGQDKEAAEILQPVYQKFTEGFDTPDLKAAKATLDLVNS